MRCAWGNDAFVRAYSLHICVASGVLPGEQLRIVRVKVHNEFELKSGDPREPDALGDGKLERCESGAAAGAFALPEEVIRKDVRD